MRRFNAKHKNTDTNEMHCWALHSSFSSHRLKHNSVQILVYSRREMGGKNRREWPCSIFIAVRVLRPLYARGRQSECDRVKWKKTKESFTKRVLWNAKRAEQQNVSEWNWSSERRKRRRKKNIDEICIILSYAVQPHIPLYWAKQYWKNKEGGVLMKTLLSSQTHIVYFKTDGECIYFGLCVHSLTRHPTNRTKLHARFADRLMNSTQTHTHPNTIQMAGSFNVQFALCERPSESNAQYGMNRSKNEQYISFVWQMQLHCVRHMFTWKMTVNLPN